MFHEFRNINTILCISAKNSTVWIIMRCEQYVKQKVND